MIDVVEGAPFDINVYEVRVVRLALERWAP
jgi:hypothetical protein